MLDVIKWVIISLILIMLVHHLFTFLKNTLTVPKVKDMVYKPSQLYKEIDNTLELSKSNNINESSDNLQKDIPDKIDTNEMKNELKMFFNELNKTKQNPQDLQQPFSQSFSQQLPKELGNISNNLYSEI